MFTREAAIGRDTAIEAGAAAMRWYGRTSSERKADQSVVTEADHASNTVIVHRLASEFPADAILSEESKDSGARLAARRVWIIDPLDGTREFISQNGEFAVMVGLVEDGEPVVGVVHLPAAGVTYTAVRGEGAWVERTGEIDRVELGPATGGLRAVGSRSHSEPLLESMCHALGILDLLPCGSVGVKCGRILDGERDLYVHPVPYLKEWDTCAPEIIVREAGGSVSDCRGQPLAYNKLDPRQPDGIVVCLADRMQEVLDVVRPLYEGALANS